MLSEKQLREAFYATNTSEPLEEGWPGLERFARLIEKMAIELGTNKPNPILDFFKYSHLPEHLQEVSKPLSELANKMDNILPNCAEKSAGLRKLLEAKDCFVRAKI